MEKMHFPKKGMMVMDQHMLSVPLRQLKRITLLSHKYSEYGLSQIKSELRNLMSLQARDGEQDGSMKAESVESLKKMITLTENLMMKV